jgi:hypothetical protein
VPVVRLRLLAPVVRLRLLALFVDVRLHRVRRLVLRLVLC